VTGRPATAVIVLNWNNAPDTLACLESLRASRAELELIVVDNASTDGSGEVIARSGLADCVLRNATNAGYAGGNNTGLRHALNQGFEVIAVLNNDTLVEPDTFERMSSICAESTHPVAVSPRITYDAAPEDIWFAGGIVDHGMPRHLQVDELTGRESGLVATQLLTGCCIMATATTWRRVGLFDERYFLIFEDSDWSMRARRLGVTLLVDHESRLRHKVSRSFGNGAMPLLATYFYTRNGLIYHARYARRYLPRFVKTRLIRPLVRHTGLPPRSPIFAWWGACDWILGHRGDAGGLTRRAATRLCVDAVGA